MCLRSTVFVEFLFNQLLTAGFRPPYYIVQQYDTLSSMCRAFTVTVAELLAVKPTLASHPDLIRIGDVVYISAGPIIDAVTTPVPVPLPL